MGGNVSYIGHDDGTVTREFRAQMQLWVNEARGKPLDARTWINSCDEAESRWQGFIHERHVRRPLAMALHQELRMEFDAIGSELGASVLEYLPQAKRVCLEILRNLEGFDSLQVRLDMIVSHTMGVMHELGSFTNYGKGDEAADFLWELISERPQKIKEIFEQLGKSAQFSSRATMFLAMMRMHGTAEAQDQAKDAEKAMVDRLCFRPKRESATRNVVPLRPRPMRI